MKCFPDGDQMCIVADDFVDLQESPAVFVSIKSELGQKLFKEFEKKKQEQADAEKEFMDQRRAEEEVMSQEAEEKQEASG